MEELLFWFDLFGITVFALSGALMAGRYKLDPFGVVVLSAVTAIGGGTIRDVILQTPVFWVVKPYYLYLIAATAILTIIVVREPKLIPKRFLLIADAFGLALFAVLGTEKAISLGAPMSVAIVMGTITGVAGGMIRDMICNVIPMILRQEIYALAAMLGGTLFVVLNQMQLPDQYALIIATTGALLLRLAAIYWKVSLPAFHISETDEKPKSDKRSLSSTTFEAAKDSEKNK